MTAQEKSAAQTAFGFLQPALSLANYQLEDFLEALEERKEWRWRAPTKLTDGIVSGVLKPVGENSWKIVVDPDHLSHNGGIEWASRQSSLSRALNAELNGGDVGKTAASK